MARKTMVYVDGFNLYYGSLKNTRHKWLNLEALCKLVLPAQHHVVTGIKYFTARTVARADDPQQPIRQQLYLRALATTPIVQVIYGHFLAHPTRLPLAQPPSTGPRTVEVLKVEEKGSDVNLATHLLCDGYERRFEAAVVISNDSDLVGPIRVVRERLHLVVGVLNPRPDTPAVQLTKTASFIRPIRQGPLKESQFSKHLHDVDGQFARPERW